MWFEAFQSQDINFLVLKIFKFKKSYTPVLNSKYKALHKGRVTHLSSLQPHPRPLPPLPRSPIVSSLTRLFPHPSPGCEVSDTHVGEGARVAFAEVDSDHTRDSATRFFSLCDKSWSPLPVSRQSPANVRIGSGCAGSLGAFPFIAPTGGMEVQRPLEISKFGQSVGGGAGCVCAKNTSPRLGWRLHTQSRQGGKAGVAAHLHSESLTKPLEVSCTEPVPLTPTPTAQVTREAVVPVPR